MPATALPVPQSDDARGAAWLGGNMPVARFGLILNLFVPLIILIWDAEHGNLGADPVNYATHTTGLVAVTFLLSSLAITPLRMVTGWSWVVQFRRSLGAYAFYYACAHLAIYFWWDRQHNLTSTIHEITHRYYLLIGFLSLVLMAPLWATSFNAAIRAMGGVWWKRLHRLAYVAAGLACWHLYLQTKADKRRPEVYIAVLATLLLWRVGVFARKRWRASAQDRLTAGADSTKAPLSKNEEPSVVALVNVADPNRESSAGEISSGATSVTVTFARCGQSASLRADQTVLEAAESVGVSIDYQCRSGICGTCRCKLLSGHVRMEIRDALSDADEADGYILACQARAAEHLTIDA